MRRAHGHAGAVRPADAYLADEGYAVVDVLTATAMLGGGAVLRGRRSLSFDDGCLDVAENALPVLAEHEFRATMFIAPPRRQPETA